MQYVRWNGRNWNEHEVPNWLAARLHRSPADPASDWNLAMTWDKSHWFKLMEKLKNVKPEDQKTIDRKFAEYARANHLLDDDFLRERERRIKEGAHGYFEHPPQVSKPRPAVNVTFTLPPRPARRSLLKRINDFRLF